MLTTVEILLEFKISNSFNDNDILLKNSLKGPKIPLLIELIIWWSGSPDLDDQVVRKKR